jgi:uncharacterized protein YcbK (DUF882 family)
MTWERMRSAVGRLLGGLERPGLSHRQQRVLDVASVGVLGLFAIGWSAAVLAAAQEGVPLQAGGQLTANPLAPGARPEPARVLDQLARIATDEARFRGRSGEVRIIVPEPGRPLDLADTLGLDELPPWAAIEVSPVDEPDARQPGDRVADLPGAWNVLLRVRDQVREVAGLVVLTPFPADLIEGGRLGSYLIGEWPDRPARRPVFRTPEYDPPRGLVAVTPENIALPISRHLVLGDFLTKGQEGVWPKYVVISPRVLDKLELTLQELERMGHPVENVGVISAFRTPHYNAHGGATAGRGAVSRHMYGDAIDFYIDNVGDGRMDDLNGDGRVDVADLRLVAEAAERVERRYPEYVGGIGIYPPVRGSHSGFIHIDTRGTRARW